MFKYFELDENENRFVAAVKAALSGKFIASNAYVRKEEKSKINNLSFHFRKLEKEE